MTAVFATPYADWNLLFRDVEALGTQGSCSIASLLSRPTLGPYSVASATTSRIVLTMNKHWPVDTDRFGRIVITDAGAIADVGRRVLRQLLARREPRAGPGDQRRTPT